MDDEEFGTTDDYLRAFEAVRAEGIPDNHLALLQAHFAAPDHTATWAQLAAVVGYPNFNAVNLQYGRLAARVAARLGITQPPLDFWLSVLAGWAAERDPDSGHTAFVLRRPVIEALRLLGLLAGSSVRNIVLRREEDLSDSNYILNAQPGNKYWVNITSGRVKEFLARCGEAFNIVIVGSADDDGDFYAIPYPVLKPVLTEQYLTWGKQAPRWVARIPNHRFQVDTCPIPVDVGAFYGNSAALTNPGRADPDSADDANEYAIENRRKEVEQRLKQSVFRRRIMENFERRCCLSGISEDELLVASHIVPWSKRIDTRLDPANGLLLYTPYDRLFDKGFISFDDSLRVIVSPRSAACSPPLRSILDQLAGQQGRRPVRWDIKPEYLAYHRAEVFKADRPVPDAHAAASKVA